MNDDTSIGREAGDDMGTRSPSYTPSPLSHAPSPTHERSPSHDDEKPVSPAVVAPVATPARARKESRKVSQKKPCAKGKAASKKAPAKAKGKAKVNQVKAKEATAEKKQVRIKDDVEKKLHSVPKLKHIPTTTFCLSSH